MAQQNLAGFNPEIDLITLRVPKGIFFVKLYFEIAVGQQTKTGDRTFEWVPDPNVVSAWQLRPYLVLIMPNLTKYPEHVQNPGLYADIFGQMHQI